MFMCDYVYCCQPTEFPSLSCHLHLTLFLNPFTPIIPSLSMLSLSPFASPPENSNPQSHGEESFFAWTAPHAPLSKMSNLQILHLEISGEKKKIKRTLPFRTPTNCFCKTETRQVTTSTSAISWLTDYLRCLVRVKTRIRVDGSQTLQ